MEEIPTRVMSQLRKAPWIKRRIVYKSLIEREFAVENASEFRRAFDFLDIDKDGLISPSDLMSIAKLMGGEIPNESDVNRWIRVFDMNHDLRISFDEFVATLIVKMDNFMKEMEILDLFQKCDGSNRGYITIENIIQAMANIGKNLQVSEARLMIREVNSDCTNGKIEIAEFNRIMGIMRKDILFCVGAILST